MSIWGFPKIRGTLLGVPIVFWGLYWGPLNLGNYHIGDNGKENENYYLGVGCRELKETLEPDKRTSNPIKGYYYCYYCYYYYDYYDYYLFINGQPF